MLNFRKRRRHLGDTPRLVSSENPDLQIRSLLEYPELRRVMGLDIADERDVAAPLHQAAA